MTESKKTPVSACPVTPRVATGSEKRTSSCPPTLSRIENQETPAREPTLLSEEAPGQRTVPAPPPKEQPGAGFVLGGRYQLLDLIAAGGMGKVYRGRHLELRTPIAVKIMHGYVAENAEHIERFRREARAASHLNHPNVVRILDFGEVADTFYIVMEFIEGISLGGWLEKHTFPPRLETVLPVLLQILDALSQAHQLGIIHRDLKPDNVILTTDINSMLWCKLVDFGLARFQQDSENDQTLTRPDAVAGTPGYMSPEQCRSLRVTASTDLYAFGCILTEILQLAPPFTGESTMDVISKHMFAPVPDLVRPEAAEPIPPLLERLRLDLLAKTPAHRPASAQVARQRLLEAFNPVVNTAAFPPRTNSFATGTRAERMPTWNLDTVTVKNLTVEGSRPVARLSAGDNANHMDETCLIGLASQGFQLVDTSDLSSSEPALLVIEGASSIDDSIALLKRVRAAWPGTRIVLCSAALTAELLNQVIEAGADDVVRYPVAAETLGRKLERLSRRIRC